MGLNMASMKAIQEVVNTHSTNEAIRKTGNALVAALSEVYPDEGAKVLTQRLADFQVAADAVSHIAVGVSENSMYFGTGDGENSWEPPDEYTALRVAAKVSIFVCHQHVGGAAPNPTSHSAWVRAHWCWGVQEVADVLEVQTSVAMVEPHLIDSFSHTGLESYPADAAMCTAIAASLGALFQNTMNRRAFAASSGMSALLLALGSEAGVSGELAEDAEAVAAAALQRDTAVVGLLHALLTASSGEEAVTLQEEVAEDEDGIKVHAPTLVVTPPCLVW